MSELTYKKMKFYVCQFIKIIEGQDRLLQEQHKIIFNLRKKGILEGDQPSDNEKSIN